MTLEDLATQIKDFQLPPWPPGTPPIAPPPLSTQPGATPLPTIPNSIPYGQSNPIPLKKIAGQGGFCFLCSDPNTSLVGRIYPCAVCFMELILGNLLLLLLFLLGLYLMFRPEVNKVAKDAVKLATL